MKITIIMEDPIIHDEQHPYCSDPECPCHLDEEQAIRDELEHEFGCREIWFFRGDEEHE